METERKCTGGVQVIEQQTAELTFRFDGTERKRHRFYASYCSNMAIWLNRMDTCARQSAAFLV